MSTETRPYPNVRRARSKNGKWEALHPLNGTSRYIGTFDTPEDAYRAVLLAQADHLEAKARGYRERAHHLTAAS